MIYKFVVSFLILNLIYEFIEIIFPIKKLRGLVKSFVLIVFLYAMVEGFVGLL